MLSVCGKGQRRKGNTDSRARKADTLGQEGENFGKNENDIEICQNTKSVNTDIDQTYGHTEFIKEGYTVARAVNELFISVKASSVEEKAHEDRCGEKNQEKDIHKSAILIRKRIVGGIFNDQRFGLGCTKRFIHKGINKDTENTDGKSRLIHIEAAVHCRRAGEQGGNDKSCRKSEKDCQNDTKRGDLRLAKFKVAAERIAEQKVADERAERRGKERNVNVFTERLFRDEAIEQNADKGRPHIDKIESVKAMRDDEHIARKGGGRGFHTAEQNDGVAGKSANGGVKKRTAKTAKTEIVGDKARG